MPETLTGTTTPGDGPVVGEPQTVELSPAELGLNNVAPVETPETPTTDETPPAPDDNDYVGAALKRGRPPRDFTGLTEEEKEIFQGMHRKSYEKLYPLYMKVKGHEADIDQLPTLKEKLAALEKAQATKPSAFYDHEDAYLLQQDFRDALRESSTLRDIASHWQEQLIAAEEGKPIRDLITDANGNLQLGPPMEATPRAKAQIQSLLMQSNQAYTAHQQKLNSIKSAHAEQFKTYKTGLQTAYDKFFGKYKDQLEPLAKKELEVFPEFARSRPEINLLGHALALIRHIVQSDKANQTQAAVGKANSNGQKIAGPTMKNITTAPRGNPELTSLEEEKQIRRQFGF